MTHPLSLPLMLLGFVTCSYVLLLPIGFAYVEGWGYSSAYYYAVQAAMGIGFGALNLEHDDLFERPDPDDHPTTEEGQGFHFEIMLDALECISKATNNI